jgi:predicted secreted protein
MPARARCGLVVKDIVMSQSEQFTSYVTPYSLRQTRPAALALALAALLGAAAVRAQTQTQAIPVEPSNPRVVLLPASGDDGGHVVNLSASASVEVVPDTLTITSRVLRQGNDSVALQAQLKQLLDTALSEARRAAAAPAVEVRTGNFNISPRYGNNGSVVGWQGQAELVVEGRDVARVATLAGKLPGFAVAGSSFSVSPELRERHDSELVAQAIERFRRRAADIAKAFGFAEVSLREVHVAHADGEVARPMLMSAMARQVTMADAVAPVPVEAGLVRLSASVQGSVRLQGKR